MAKLVKVDGAVTQGKEAHEAQEISSRAGESTTKRIKHEYDDDQSENHLIGDCRLYISNLACAATEGDLANFLKGYSIVSMTIPKNSRTGDPCGYAFVSLSTLIEAARAIVELSDKEMFDRKGFLQLARKDNHRAGNGRK